MMETANNINADEAPKVKTEKELKKEAAKAAKLAKFQAKQEALKQKETATGEVR